jgi:hypothetical protein
MEWRILNLDKTIEQTLESEEALETLLSEASASHTEGDGSMVAYFYYMEGLFTELETAYSGSSDMVRVIANDDHYDRLLAEVSGSEA